VEKLALRLADKKEYKSQATYGMAFSKMFSAMAEAQRKREEQERKRLEKLHAKQMQPKVKTWKKKTINS